MRSRGHELKVECIRAVRNIYTLSNLVFAVEELWGTGKEMVHDKRILSYPAWQSDDETSWKLVDYTKYLHNTLQLIKRLRDIRMKNAEYEIFVSKEGWNDKEDRRNRSWD